jgi:flavin reductase (DIM6/NTAB) family NADH-FMN oxidoreductase RutF
MDGFGKRWPSQCSAGLCANRNMISNEIFELGFRRLASGVSCVATKWNGQPHGFVVISVSSLGNEPPTLIVYVNRTVSSHGSISESGILCVNVLCHGDLVPAILFADKDRRQSRFASQNWTEMRTGAPNSARLSLPLIASSMTR